MSTVQFRTAGLFTIFIGPLWTLNLPAQEAAFVDQAAGRIRQPSVETIVSSGQDAETIIRLLVERLEDDAPDVRIAAVDALGERGGTGGHSCAVAPEVVR